MSETKHTPGPWTAHFYETNQRTHGGRWIFVSKQGTVDQQNVQLDGCSRKNPRPAANAALIAAAPETAAERDRLREEVETLRSQLLEVAQDRNEARDQRDALRAALETTLRYAVAFAGEARDIDTHDWMQTGKLPEAFSEASWIKTAQAAIRASRGEG